MKKHIFANFSEETLLTKAFFCGILYYVKVGKESLLKIKTKIHMTHNKQGTSVPQTFDFSLVYLYLLTGILLFISVFLFLPHVSVG